MNFSKIWVDAGRKTNLVISNHLFRGNKIGHQKIIFAHGLREKYVILDYCKLYVMEIIKIETQWHLKAYPKSIGPTLALKTSYLNLAPNEPQIYKVMESRITTDFLRG